MKSYLSKHIEQRKITTYIENRSVYNSDFAQLDIFETQKVVEKVKLNFDFPIIASMIRGKKIMHLQGRPAFDFLPGESIVMPRGDDLIIDFPEATTENPTICLALGLEEDKINQVVQRFNDRVRIDEEKHQWHMDDQASCLLQDPSINNLLKRLVTTFTDNVESKSVLIDLMVQELIIRLLQTKAKLAILTDTAGVFSDTRIGTALKYIQDHLTDHNISVELLAQKSYMSTSHFHRKFKNTLGVSPIDYINAEKIKFAKKLMKERKNLRISEIAMLSGFNSISYFNRQFKKLEFTTPKNFRKSLSF